MSALAHELSLSECAQRCAEVVKRENDRLPQSSSEERIARRRPPKNHTDALLRSGMSLDDVVRHAAMRVVEEWVHVLRVHVHRTDMVNTLAGIVHGGIQRPLSRSQSLGSMTFSSQFDGSLRLVLNPNPTPPASTPLGAALRRLVPAHGGRCEFVEDITAALELEDDYIATSPTHIQRPTPAMRSELSSKQLHEDDLDYRMGPRCYKNKEDVAANRPSGYINAKEGAYRNIGTTAALRCSGSCGGWSTFSQNHPTRVTNLGFTGKVVLDQPGPGEYKRPVSSMRPCRIGLWPSVGKPRPVGHAVMGSNLDRFTVTFA